MLVCPLICCFRCALLQWLNWFQLKIDLIYNVNQGSNNYMNNWMTKKLRENLFASKLHLNSIPRLIQNFNLCSGYYHISLAQLGFALYYNNNPGKIKCYRGFVKPELQLAKSSQFN